MLVEIARFFGLDAAGEVDLVDRHIMHQPLVLDRQRRGESVERGLDEVRQRKGRGLVAHRHIRRGQHQLAIVIERRPARDPEVVGEVVSHHSAELLRSERIVLPEQLARQRGKRRREDGCRLAPLGQRLVHRGFYVGGFDQRGERGGGVGIKLRLDRLEAFGAAGDQHHVGDMAILNEGTRGLRKVIDEVFADDPHRLAAHLVEPLLLGRAEQFALGGGAFHAEAAGRHEGFTRNRTVGEKEHGCLRHIMLRRHLAKIELGQHPGANLLGLHRDLVGGEEGRVFGRHAHQPIAVFRRGALGPLRRVQEQARLPQPPDQRGGDGGGEQVLIPGAGPVALARAGQRQFTQFARVVGVVAHLGGVIAGEPRQHRLDPHAAPDCLDRGGMDGVEALVLKDQLAAPLEQPGLTAGA